MIRPQVVRMCQARNYSGRSMAGACPNRARWWIGRPYARRDGATDYRQVCGTHSRAYRARWPIVSADAVADRDLAWEAFR